MQKILRYLFISVLILSCKQEEPKTNDTQTVNKATSGGVNVDTQIITQTIFQKQLVANGKISALEKSELRFQTSESIKEINVVNGQKVNKGDVLAFLENALLKNALEKAKIDLEKAKNQLRQEKINYGVKANQKINASVLKSLQIKSGLFEAQNALQNAEIQYKQTILLAPFSGVIANIEAKEGNYSTPSDIFCMIINTENLEVEFSILENEIDFVAKNQKIEIQSFNSSKERYKGVISEVNPLVDENGLIKIRAKINSKAATLFDGMNVKVFINKPMGDVIVVPKEALVLRSNREVVFTVENNFAKWKYVTQVGENSTNYAIKKGENLKETDTIIVSGNLNLSHDAKVNATFKDNNNPKK